MKLPDSIIIERGHASSREGCAVMMEAPKHRMPIKVQSTPGRSNSLHVGSVEFCEGAYGKKHPDFYPSWANHLIGRKVTTKKTFVKDSRSYKNMETIRGVFHLSEVVEFEDEWRYYIVDGGVVCSWWYKGKDDDCDKDPHGPRLPEMPKIPPAWCGTIDMGMIVKKGGARVDPYIAVVECHHPYAIGWYGEMSDSADYFKFLLSGWNYLTQPAKTRYR